MKHLLLFLPLLWPCLRLSQAILLVSAAYDIQRAQLHRNRPGRPTSSVSPPLCAARLLMWVAVQEVDSAHTTQRRTLCASGELASLTGMHANFARAIDFQGGAYGIGVLSKRKPLSCTTCARCLGARRRGRCLWWNSRVFLRLHASVAHRDRPYGRPRHNRTYGIRKRQTLLHRRAISTQTCRWVRLFSSGLSGGGVKALLNFTIIVCWRAVIAGTPGAGLGDTYMPARSCGVKG